jgi:hypothetical protein
MAIRDQSVNPEGRHPVNEAMTVATAIRMVFQTMAASSGCDKVCAAEYGQDVVRCLAIREVVHAEADTQFDPNRVKPVIRSRSEIEHMPRSDSGWVADISSSFGGNPDARRPVIRRGVICIRQRRPKSLISNSDAPECGGRIASK